eukprot:2399477-Prymnesium_polylepis.1
MRRALRRLRPSFRERSLSSHRLAAAAAATAAAAAAAAAAASAAAAGRPACWSFAPCQASPRSAAPRRL